MQSERACSSPGRFTLGSSTRSSRSSCQAKTLPTVRPNHISNDRPSMQHTRSRLVPRLGNIDTRRGASTAATPAPRPPSFHRYCKYPLASATVGRRTCWRIYLFAPSTGLGAPDPQQILGSLAHQTRYLDHPCLRLFAPRLSDSIIARRSVAVLDIPCTSVRFHRQRTCV